MRFKDFLNETEASDKEIGESSDLLKRYFNTIPGNKYKEFGRITVSKYGKTGVIQNIYIDQSGKAFGVNWTKSGRFLGVSIWNTFAGADRTPDFEVEGNSADFGDKDWFGKYCHRIVRAAQLQQEEDDIDDLDESLIKEAAPVFKYGSDTYRGLMPLIQAMYDNGESERDIINNINKTYGNASKESFIRTAYRMLEDGAVDLKAGDVYANLNGKIAKNSSSGPVKVIGGRAQQEEDSDDIEDAEATFMKTKYADPAVVYKHLEAYTKSICEGTTTALLITGKGGTGKSYTVDKVLNKYAGGEWVKMKGKASAKGMYRYLYYHYNQIVVFDDCDSVFGDKDGINILKGALDTSDHRVIGWLNDDPGCVNTEGLTHEETEMRLAEWSEENHGKPCFPSEFVFEGQVIFISNLTLEQIRKRDSALLTRCQVLDVTLDAKGLISRMETILPTIRYYKARCKDGQKVEITNEKDKKEVLEYLKTDEAQQKLKDKGEEFSIRTIIKACKLKLSCPDMWKELI